MENNYLDQSNLTKTVHHTYSVKECSETRLPIWKFEFYLIKRGYIVNRWHYSNNKVGKGHIVDNKKLVVTVNSYMSYDDVSLMKELILNEY